ncbi:hypothetical protein Pcinc_014580 [Petrolisthes cinctipes]|uniref:Uncharacterized protein n=1 Tax=Petrolisthes cinctipes TaxID=88211 RepID=A0AAE1KD02_PETCI|nr:hypothetical protein Pcinc_022914 [Petrolisthes cinctipes]KAK3880930.1 hypothetical protein Pcinc_014580 [Petrolisthes cinctipes]
MDARKMCHTVAGASRTEDMGPLQDIIMLPEGVVDDDLPDVITHFNSTQINHPAASSAASSELPVEVKLVYEAQERAYKAKEAAWMAIETYYKRKINKEFNS